MIRKFYNYLLDTRDRQSISIALSKGGAMMHARNIDLRYPGTWEFSGFSQNGEDGILDVLRNKLLDSNRYCIEIGAADGLENNTAWLIVAEKYSALLIEGSEKLLERAERMVGGYSIGVECRNMFVTKESVQDVKDMAWHDNPDVFSLDIDGNDYYIAQAVLDIGIRPKIFVVEFNSVYGPDRCMTVEYKADFVFTKEHPTHLYYGVSITAWRRLFEQHGYQFVTVDRNGVNGFFVDPQYFDESFLDGVSGLPFAENLAQYKKHKISCEAQFALISDQKFVSV